MLLIFMLLFEMETVTLSVVFMIIGSITGGIFILAFAEVLERLERIDKNTQNEKD